MTEDGAGYCSALCLPARELAALSDPEFFPKSHITKCLLTLCPQFLFIIHLIGGSTLHDTMQHIVFWVKGVLGILKDHLKAAAGPAKRAGTSQFPATETNRTRILLEKAGNEGSRCGFPAATFADQAEALPLRHFQGHMVHCGNPVPLLLECLREIFHFQQSHVTPPSPAAWELPQSASG